MTLQQQIFNKMLTSLEPSMSAVDFDVWIKTLEPVAVKDNRLILGASNDRTSAFVATKFSDKLVKVLKKVNDTISCISIVGPDEAKEYKNNLEFSKEIEVSKSSSSEKEKEYLPRTEITPLIPKYNFETFVVGKSNQFMYAAAKAVADEPAVHYNPLFIYGGSGLGKTHIMHAIGNSIAVTNPEKKVMYVSSDKFLNEFIESIRRSKGAEFRDRYREIDVLMIDDVQFFAGKTGVQEELFHTFNALHAANKQLIFTSDRPPKEIQNLEERLCSRFEGGLMADVQLPDAETRTAILQKKAFALNVMIEPKVLSAMAESVSSNIRDLEGVLNRVIFLSRLNEGKPTIELVSEALKDANEKSEESVTSDKVIECVCRYYNVSKDDMLGKKKTREVAEPRQICMYLINEVVGLPLARVGESLGGRDHTTVMHARNKVLEQIQSNVKVKLAVNDIKEMLFKLH